MLGVTNRCCLAVQIVVGGTENSVVLQNLNSLTEYEIAVFAVYRSAASDALRGNEITRQSSSKLTGLCPSRLHCKTVIIPTNHMPIFYLNTLYCAILLAPSYIHCLFPNHYFIANTCQSSQQDRSEVCCIQWMIKMFEVFCLW